MQHGNGNGNGGNGGDSWLRKYLFVTVCGVLITLLGFTAWLMHTQAMTTIEDLSKDFKSTIAEMRKTNNETEKRVTVIETDANYTKQKLTEVSQDVKELLKRTVK